MGAMTAAFAVAAVMAGFAMRLAMAAIFVMSAAHALRNRADYARIVQAYRILPEWAGRIFAVLLPPMECVIAFALLLPTTRSFGCLAALAMLACFSFAIAFNLVRGRRNIACGCGGGVGQAISWALVSRNILLFGGVAASLAAPTHPRPDTAAIVGIAGLAGFVAVLYLAANQLMVNAQVLPRITMEARG